MEIRNTQELMQYLSEVAQPVRAAHAANLRYVSDDSPGIRRARRGRGFSYYDPDGALIRDPRVRRQLDELVIPPAWTDVWICPDPNGHILVTGRDDRGRKQYLYHPRWQEVRNETKFNRMIVFGRLLPTIRAHADRDLRRRGLPREKVLAVVVRLLEETLIRIGNAEYAQANDSYGLTTLKDWHAEISGAQVAFGFRGKSGKVHTVNVRDRRLARIVQQCKEIPGYELFQYVDEAGERHTIDSNDVNHYLRAITGEDFTAKDFRTWGGSVLALRTLRDMPPPSSATDAKKRIAEAIKQVAAGLGNTPAVTRQYYIHPVVLDAYADGALHQIVEEEMAGFAADDDPYTLRHDEAALVLLLRRRTLGV